MHRTSRLSHRLGRSIALAAAPMVLGGIAVFPAAAQCERERMQTTDGRGGDLFGWSADADGQFAVVGAPNDSSAAQIAGAAYIFERLPDGSWDQVSELLAPDARGADLLGESVAISGDRAIAGSPLNDANGRESGAAYVFQRRPDGQWTFEVKLTAPDGLEADNFGGDVAIDGNLAIVGAANNDERGTDVGAAYLFRANLSGEWSLVTKLTPVNPDVREFFGSSVDIDGERIVVGAWGHNDQRGAAYIFEPDESGQWRQTARLTPSDGETTDFFAISAVQVRGDFAMVGAQQSRNEGRTAGSVHVYQFDRFNKGNWTETQELTTDRAAAGAWFGESISLGDGVAIVGAPRDEGDGSAFVLNLDLETELWSVGPKIIPSNGRPEDRVGDGVAIAGTTALLGAPLFDLEDDNVGAVFTFDLTCGLPSDLEDLDIAVGTLLEGDLGELRRSDDAAVAVRSGFGRSFDQLHLMDMVVAASTITDLPRTIELTVESRIDEPSGVARLRLRNWETGEFETVAQYSVDVQERMQVVSDIDAGPYVDDAGRLELSIRHTVFAPLLAFQFDSFVDHVEITVR